MPERTFDLEVPKELYGVRVTLRPHPETGTLEMVAHIPLKDGSVKRRRKSTGTTDREEAYDQAKRLSQALAVKTGGLAKAKIERKFVSGGDITDLDCLDYYESEVLPKLSDSYAGFVRARLTALRKLLPRVAEEQRVATPLRLIDQEYVDEYAKLRLEKGGLKRDGSGEWREYDEDDLDDDGRKVSLSTARKDLQMLSRTIQAARGHHVKDSDGRWSAAVQFNPFKDREPALELPQNDSAVRQPIMDPAEYQRMLDVADEVDASANAAYKHLRYAERFEHHHPRCPGYMGTILRVARQGRRRAAIADLQWRDVLFPDEHADRIAAIIIAILGIKIYAEEVARIFPHGVIAWRRGEDKMDYWRFAPMPAYLERHMREFRERHPNADNPVGPLFYSTQDHRKAIAPERLAEWFPKVQEAAGVAHMDGEGWHAWRRLYRQERQGHISNKITAYVGGWSRLNAVDDLLDVDEGSAMNRHYLQVLLRQMYACAAFDATKIDPSHHMPGVSEQVLAQMREEGYLESKDEVTVP